MIKPNKRVVYYDVLTVISAVAVVAMHVNSAYWNYRPTHTWILNLFIEKTMKFAVPVFFMISGATLMDYRIRYSTKTYVKKRVHRTLVPFILWSIIGLLFSIYYTHSTQKTSLIHYINMIITTSIPEVNVYWFFIPLFLAYMAIPVLSLIPTDKRDSIFLYLIAWHLAFTFLRALSPFIGLTVNSVLDNPFTANELFYVILGYLLTHIELNKNMLIGLITTGFLSLIASFCGTLTASFTSGKLVNATVFDSLYFLYPISIFLITKIIFHNYRVPDNVTRYIAILSSCSFGVYLIHKFVLTIIVKLWHVNVIIWQWPFVGTIIVIIVSACLVFILKHTPFLKVLV